MTKGQMDQTVWMGMSSPAGNLENLDGLLDSVEEDASLKIKSLGDYLVADNKGRFRVFFDPDGLTIAPNDTQFPDEAMLDWRVGVHHESLGRTGSTVPAIQSRPTAAGARVTWTRDSANETYLNKEEGVELVIEVINPPAGDGAVTVEYSVSGTLNFRARDEIEGHGSNEIIFSEADGSEVLYLGSLSAEDAFGARLPSWFESEGKGVIRIAVDDEGAVYPITIDPLFTSASWTGESDQAGAYFGFSVASAGDVNGDGFTDVIVGAPFFDNGEANEGRAYLFLGGASGLSTTPAWTAEGNQVEARFGQSVASAGDVNADGYADVIVGAPYYDNGETNEGRTHLFLGGSSGLSSAPAWTVESNQADAQLGYSVGAAGDVDGDGYGDVIVGAPYFDNGEADEGMAYVYRGGPGGLAPSPAWSGEANQAGAQFGWSVAGAGDVNRDGYADIAIAAPRFTNGESLEGRVYIYAGSPGGPLAVPWTVESNQANALFGSSVSSAGDTNGDGYSDVVVGSYLYDNGETDEGRAFLYTGSSSGISATPAWTAESNQAGAQFGWSVASAGDVNGDGFSDVIVGSNLEESVGNTDEGRAYLYLGRASGLESTAVWTNEINQDFAEFGFSVAGGGDTNGDGYGDVAIGAYKFDGGQTDEGRAYLFRGYALGPRTSADASIYGTRDDHFSYSVASAGDVNGDGYEDVIVGEPDIDMWDAGNAYLYLGGSAGLSTTASWTGTSGQLYSSFGKSVAGAGDVNGDGYSDVIVGAPDYDNGESGEGRAFLYLGGASGLSAAPAWTAESNQADSHFGYSVASAGDVNGDGYSDVIVGAVDYNGSYTDEGRAYLYLGSPTGLSATSAWTVYGGQSNAHLGLSVAGAGDVNGDGYSDILVAAPDYDNGQTDEGIVRLYLGRPSGPSTTPSWTGEVNQGSARFGYSVAGAGDVNGDGYGDVIVGAVDYANGNTDEGRALLYLGSSTGLSTTAAWTGESNQSYAYFGQAVAGAGDVDGDGYADVVVGAPGYDSWGYSSNGRSYIFFGSQSGLSAASGWDDAGLQSNSWFGFSVAGIADVNGDGYGDVIIGEPYYDFVSTNDGRAKIYYGGDRRTGAVINLRQLKADGVSLIPDGGNAGGSTVVFKGRVYNTSPLGDLVRLEVEVKPVGQAFTGSGTLRSAPALPGDEAIVTVSGLTGGPKRWRARTVFPQSFGYGRWSALDGSAHAQAEFIVPLSSGTPCAGGSICASGFCVDGVCCDSACTGFCAACTAARKGAGSDGVCGYIASGRDPDGECADQGASSCGRNGFCDGSGACELYAAGTTCRAAAGPCDAAETCPGGAAPCPSDALEPSTTVCRASAGACDAAEYCTGISINCPSDAYQPATVECRSAAGDCDIAEFCTGSSTSCPANAFRPSSFECRSATGACDAAEFCSGWSANCPSDSFQPAAFQCRPSAGACDVAENCTGSSAVCPADALQPPTLVCRAAAGTCDVAENCTGASALCPSDQLRPSGYECRAAAGICDLSETCTGSSAACPADSYQPATLVCRPAAGDCDLAENCTGASAACPADAFRSSSFACRASAGTCDLSESCTGSSAACPADSYQPATLVCRAAAGECDLAENCTGASAACPADQLRPSTYVCRASAGVCDLSETCSGASAACPADAYQPATFECRAAAGDCDIGENCTGASAACPADAFRSSSFACRASAGTCDLSETCTGSSAACPADVFRPSTYECRAAAGACDLAENCTGIFSFCPADQMQPSSYVCRASAGACDIPENCTGASDICPADALRPSTYECRAAAGVCDLAESCTGTSTLCPANQMRPSSYVCRASAGICDLPENCTGASAACPADVFRPSTYECRAAVEICDIAENCTGTSIDCPENLYAAPGAVCRLASSSCDAEEACDGSIPACPPDRALDAGEVCRPIAGQCDVEETCDGLSRTCPPDDDSSANGRICDDGLGWTSDDACLDGDCIGTESGSCENPVEISSLPYSDSNTTTDRPSHVSGYGDLCGATSRPSGDVVYRFFAESGASYEISVIPQAGFDAAMAIISACIEDQDCLAAADSAGNGVQESLQFSPAEDGEYYIVVEGSGGNESGDFDLSVVEVQLEEEAEAIEEAEAEVEEAEPQEEAEFQEEADISEIEEQADGEADGEIEEDTDATGFDASLDAENIEEEDAGEADTGSEGAPGCGCTLVR